MIEKITIKGTEYTLEEARELYNELHELFGKLEFPFVPYVPASPVFPEPYNPLPYRWDWITTDTPIPRPEWEITCGSDNGNN